MPKNVKISNTVDFTVQHTVTKQKQWIRIGKNQELMDTPGVLWPKFESNEVALNLSFTGTIKDEILDKVDVAYELLKLLEKDYLENIKQRYKLTDEEIEKTKQEENSIYELMKLIAHLREILNIISIISFLVGDFFSFNALYAFSTKLKLVSIPNGLFAQGLIVTEFTPDNILHVIARLYS